MKAGLAALTRAALDLAALPPGRGGLLVIFSAGEESGCEGADFLASSPRVLEPAGALLVAEPTSNQPCLGHKGALWMKGVALGKGAHASMPEQGVNAIYKAARAITKLEKYEFPVTPHPLLGSPTLNVGTVQGGTKVNMVPDKAAFDLDARTLPGQDHDDVIALLNQELGPDVELTRHSGGAEAVWTSEDHPWVQEVFAVMSSLTGKTFQPQGLTYFTDASSLSRAMSGVPAIILGPGEAAMAHQTDEYCLVENIEQAEEAFREIGRRWLGL
jgi:succinyl-diaminopimelate desuccinylase